MTSDDDEPTVAAPFRSVQRAEPILDGTLAPTWMLLLACGHTVYRPAKWVNKPATTAPRNPAPEELHPPQGKARCQECGRAAAGLPPKTDPKLPADVASLISSLGAAVQASPPGSIFIVAASAATDHDEAEPPACPTHAAPAGHPSVGVREDGVHVVACPDCRGLKTVCPNCSATGTIPPALPTHLREDYVLGYWFACNGVFDVFSTIVCRPWGWVGVARVAHHHIPKIRLSVFRPPKEYTADQVIDCHNRCEDEALMDDANLPGVDPAGPRWRVFTDVRSNDPGLIQRRWDAFVASCGEHLR